MKRYMAMAIALQIPLMCVCLAEVPDMLNYQGRMVEDGHLVNSNGMAVTLTLWNAPDGGSNMYQEVDSVDVVDGLYTTTLGENQSGGGASDLADAVNRLGTNAWLGIAFGNGAELTPRERLLAAPFAVAVRGMYVDESENVGVGSTSPGQKLDVEGGIEIGNTTSPTPGAMRWTGSDFEGYDGSQWVSLTFQTGRSAPSGMSRIPVGPFLMGTPFDTNSVIISEFFIDKFEVTNGKMRDMMQWAYDEGLLLAGSGAVTNRQGNRQELLDLDSSYCQISFSGETFTVDEDKDDFPCVEVSWYGAQAYCNYRSDREGLPRCINFADWSCDFEKKGYRLPTESEWEKAARGGLVSKQFPWGETIDASMANYSSSGDPFETGDFPWTSPVGYFDGSQSPAGYDMANGYGLYDVAGNAWEWCWDWYASSPPADGSIDPNGPAGPLSFRVLRGGSWGNGTYALWVGYRYGDRPSESDDREGFRCVRGP